MIRDLTTRFRPAPGKLTMIRLVTTRFKDIEWDEVKKCAREPSESKRKLWNKIRGTKIEIMTPADAHVGTGGGFVCKGPFYPVAGKDYCVCPHIAEIGD
jgi:hypothetical protein